HTGHLRGRLAAGGYAGRTDKEPFSIILGVPGFYFDVPTYRRQDGLWAAPQTDEEITMASFTIIFSVLQERLGGLKLAGVEFTSGKRRFEHAFAFQADNPLDFAILQWYLEELTELNLRFCRGCGRVIPEDRARRNAVWCSTRCEEKHKRRIQREKKRAGSATTTKKD
ncbi:hypothetical protein ACP3TI_07140, partial [Desulforudis sp. 1190]